MSLPDWVWGIKQLQWRPDYRNIARMRAPGDKEGYGWGGIKPHRKYWLMKYSFGGISTGFKSKFYERLKDKKLMLHHPYGLRSTVNGGPVRAWNMKAMGHYTPLYHHNPTHRLREKLREDSGLPTYQPEERAYEAYIRERDNKRSTCT